MNCGKRVGVDDVEGTPVPIPNTEVKLNGAEDTLLVTTRENRKMPTYKQPSVRAVAFLSPKGRHFSKVPAFFKWSAAGEFFHHKKYS